MNNILDEDYFNEKKKFACNSASCAIDKLQEFIDFVSSLNYASTPGFDSSQIHNDMDEVQGLVVGAQEYIEKALWSSENTKEEFHSWLKRKGLEGLV